MHEKLTVPYSTTTLRAYSCSASGRDGTMARKKKRKHEVIAELSNVELAKAKSALKLRIYAKEHTIGELEVGRGSLYWYGRHKQKAKRINWSRFADMMDELAYGRR